MEETQVFADEIQKAIIAEKQVFGAKVTLKQLRANKLKKIYLAQNVAQLIEEDIKYYANLQGVEVETIPLKSAEVAILCKKPFHISVIGVLA